jgi:NAD(P)-dependent dehydrogenase (short-subunit alcohol dehydrogenase family)
MGFEGKVAFVAGAGGGMGLAVANDLIAAGVNTGMADLKDPPGVSSGPGRHVYVRGDLSSDAAVKEAIERTVREFGRLDYLVNCTGVLWFDRDKSVVDMDMAIWDQVLAINLRSFALTARYAIPHIKAAGGGAMVHVSSCQALRGDRKAQDAYGASKGAIIALSKSLAIQFAADGIRSNCLLPGGTLTPMQERWRGRENEIAKSVPLGRVGTAQDQSNAIMFLLSDKASYITGTELIVDGGVNCDV